MAERMTELQLRSIEDMIGPALESAARIGHPLPIPTAARDLVAEVRRLRRLIAGVNERTDEIASLSVGSVDMLFLLQEAQDIRRELTGPAKL